MNTTTDYFERNGYVVLQGALTQQQCKDYTEYMFKLFDEGKLTKDEQCPLSDAVYGNEVFDELLQRFAKPIGDAVGKQLLPTYTYARIYRPGEVLERHKDRPACEISATLTLGYDDKPIWPIFFDEQKEISVSLDTGELAVYKGCEILHWRPAFKGKWHVQVFLHYVDANGPYKYHYKDGRNEFGVDKSKNKSNSSPDNLNISNRKSTKSLGDLKIQKPIFNTVAIRSSDYEFPGYFCIDSNNFSELKFTNSECDEIISIAKKAYPTSASIGGSAENSRITREIRSANIYHVPNNESYKWVYEKIANIISVANTIYFDYDLLGITHEIQLIEYSADMPIKGHYNWHIDAGTGEPVFRKISFTAQLSNINDYQGCELLINNHGGEITGTKERGSIHLFPSYMPHKVTPITNGIRYALVIWIHGPKRFR